jgi:hypothetical protein
MSNPLSLTAYRREKIMESWHQTTLNAAIAVMLRAGSMPVAVVTREAVLPQNGQVAVVGLLAAVHEGAPHFELCSKASSAILSHQLGLVSEY